MGVNLPLDPTGEPSAAERSIPARAPLSGDTLNAIEERILAQTYPGWDANGSPVYWIGGDGLYVLEGQSPRRVSLQAATYFLNTLDQITKGDLQPRIAANNLTLESRNITLYHTGDALP
jgi:hypothetical protein